MRYLEKLLAGAEVAGDFDAVLDRLGIRIVHGGRRVRTPRLDHFAGVSKMVAGAPHLHHFNGYLTKRNSAIVVSISSTMPKPKSSAIACFSIFRYFHGVAQF